MYNLKTRLKYRHRKKYTDSDILEPSGRKKYSKRVNRFEKIKKQSRHKKRIRMGMASISGVVAVILLGALLYEGQNLQSQLNFYQEKEASLNDQIEEEKERTEEIDKTKEYMETDEYAEDVARNKLGLVKDNEVVFEEEK